MYWCPIDEANIIYAHLWVLGGYVYVEGDTTWFLSVVFVWKVCVLYKMSTASSRRRNHSTGFSVPIVNDFRLGQSESAFLEELGVKSKFKEHN